MKNSNDESLEKKALSDKELNSESISDKTEDEIIYNNCINEEEEEFLETDSKIDPNKANLNPVEINNINSNISDSHSKNKIPLKSSANHSIPLEEKKSRKNKFHSYYSPKFAFARKKRKKNEEVKTADDLFVQALQKNKTDLATNREYDQKGNTMSTKISDIIYDKYVGQSGVKENTIDIFKINEEESNLKREGKRNKDDSKKVQDMIIRQKKFEEKKQNNLIEKEKELNEKLNKECIFMPNGISTSTRTPNDFYVSQIKFLENRNVRINEAKRTKLENEKNKNKSKPFISKASEKMATSKNPNESKEQLYERLHFEKLKNVKEKFDKPKEEKKLTKKQVNNLFDKLYKERIILKENKDKREKEKILKETTQEDHISENSNKVLLTKFLNYYQRILMEIFNRKDNFQINIDEYKLILINMGCITPNLHSDEILIKESFFNILNPQNGKIDTYTLLLFCLAALGIYKGNDESKNIPHTINNKKDNLKEKRKSGQRLSERKSQKPKPTSFNELILLSVPDLNMNKYGFTNKTAKNINKKFHTFVKGMNESWTDDIAKKKEERRQRFETSKEKKPRAASKGKESSKYNLRTSDNKKKLIPNIPNMNQKNFYNKENTESKITHKNNTISADNNKFEEMYKRLQFRKDNNLTELRQKKQQEELALCTFQPNIEKLTSNSKDKNRNKLNKKQIDNNFEKLYQEGIASYLQKRNSIDPDFDNNLDNKINCTFKPIIHQFNNEIFSKNPIKEELKQFERKRDQKLNLLGNKEYKKPMNFYIEPKINKEDIMDRVVPERYSFRNSDNEREKEREREKEKERENDKETALLKVEVNLDENNNTDKIIIYPGDDVKEKIIQFCEKHKLNEEKKNTLMNIIMEKIQETKKGEYINNDRKTERIKTFEDTKKFEIIEDSDFKGLTEKKN